MKRIRLYICTVVSLVALGVSFVRPCHAMRRGAACMTKITRGGFTPLEARANFSTGPSSVKPRRIDRVRPPLKNNMWRAKNTQLMVTPSSAERAAVNVPIAEEVNLTKKLPMFKEVDTLGLYFRGINQIAQAIFLWPAAVGTAVFSYFNPGILKQKLSEWMSARQQKDAQDVEINIETPGRASPAEPNY